MPHIRCTLGDCEFEGDWDERLEAAEVRARFEAWLAVAGTRTITTTTLQPTPETEETP